MSSPIEGNEKHHDHSAYAPKWVRDRERTNESPGIVEGKFPQRSEQSFPEKGLGSDQARANRPLDTTFSREALTTRRTWSRRAENEVPEGDEKPLWLPRTQIRAYRWCSPPRIGCAIMSPNRSIGRVQGASLPSERCVRTSL